MAMDANQFQALFSELTNFKKNRFHPLVWINGEPEIGENVYIAGMSEVYAKGARVVIGDNCDIASFVAINCADSHKKCIELSDTIERKDIIIEDHVFIGSHSVIKGGAHIGHHSVVAAGTIVGAIKAPPYSLIVGNPAQVKAGYYLRNKQAAPIPHNKPTLGKEEEEAAVRVIRSGWVAQGKEVEQLEKEFCEYLGLPEGHAVAVSSGTAALYLALWALNAANKKVAIPAYVCSSLRHAVAMAQGLELLVDSGTSNPNFDVEKLSQSGAEIAVIPHMYGIPCDFSNLAIPVIEDCAQALGARLNGMSVGLQGDVGFYSFYATKMMTSGGQGGMFVSKHRHIVDAVRDYREFDQRNDRILRFNFQITDIQAAIAREQLRKLPGFIRRREEIYQRYLDAGMPLLQEMLPNAEAVRYRAIMKTNSPDVWIERYREFDIKIINPLEEWELLGDASDFPQAYRWTQNTVSLPIYPSLDEESVNRVISVFRGGASS